MVTKKGSDKVVPTPTPPPIQSRTDIVNLLEEDDVDEADYKLMSQVLETLVSALPQPTPKQLIRMNRGLIHLLQIISGAPEDEGVPTRELLKLINSGDLHRLIKKGEKLGFIERKKIKNPHGKGNNMVVNSLTPMGFMLLDMADAYDLDRRSRRRS
jgi:hypothetical protein